MIPAGAWLVLGLALLASLAGWRLAARSVEIASEARFNQVSDALLFSIQKRISSYLNALEHTRGLFLSSRDVTRAEFRSFVSDMNLNREFPGVQGVGFTQAIAPADLRRHEAAVRSEGFPDYHVWPAGEREIYTSIVFLEPFDWRNQRAFGYDMYAEPVRQEAMRRARDSGKPAVSGAVTLVQETGVERQAGFLIYVPVNKNGLPHDTVAQRRAALTGFVYSPFRSFDLFDQLRLENRHLNLDFSVATHDGTQLYATPQAGRPATFERRMRLRVADRDWGLTVRSASAFRTASERAIPWMILFAGLSVSAMLFAGATGAQAHIKRQAAESAAEQRQEFVSIASHELNTPLTTLRLQLDMLEHPAAMQGEGAAPLRKNVDIARKQMLRLKRLVDDLNDLSRIQTGQLRLTREIFRLDELVREVLERFGEQLKIAGSPIARVELRPVVGTWDRFRIEQVFVNLLSNAIKYGAGKPIELTLDTENTWARLTVRDHGVGIAPADQARIFRRFERLAPGGRVSGLGLGLYIIEQIVSLHHGKIELWSEPGQGSAFTILLPLHEPPSGATGA